MQLNRLCIILPADIDEVEPCNDHEYHQADISSSTTKKDSPSISHCRRNRAVALVRHLLHRFQHSKWISFCYHCGVSRKHHSGLFYDTAGVDLSDKHQQVGGGNNPRIFSYAELYIGTNGFSEDQVLGSGGFGKVYKAVLPSDGTMVAVKCLAEKGDQFEKSFVAELMAVAHLRHKNLVSLRGWCVHDQHQLLLVYDYMPNRSLDRVLFPRPGNSPTLDWDRRQRIVQGLACALFYLHEQLETQIIHRDVKASNVMIDSNFNARLGDFGLARWLEHELEEYHQTDVIKTPSYSRKNHQFRLAETTRIGGTIGYLPPESFQRRRVGIATAKSDVFSFGIVVLEVVSGRRAVDLTYSSDDQIILLDWIRKLSDEGKVLQAGDSRLQDGSYGLSEMERLIHIGLLCTLHDPQSRPNMKWVVQALSGYISGKLPPLPSFLSHPLYISLTFSSDSSTNNTNTTMSSSNSACTTITSTSTSSSKFVTSTGETIYATAEYGYTSSDSSQRVHHRPTNFSMVETPREISYKEIISATNNFSESKRVAELDFGTAYHGVLDSRHHVLIKRLGMKTCPALRARFSNELQNLGRLRHRNMVQLRGWCTEQGEMLVVYDYLANRLLSHMLLFHHHHKSGGGNSVLPWHHRYSIIRSLASAILYLHEEWDEQVIHRNITSSSVILDPDMNPRLTSFALAEFLTRNEHGDHFVTNTNSSARGIFGYMSPEYVESGTATPMADVYSFGVVVLEVVSGRMAVDFRTPDVLLVKRVHDFEVQKRPLDELADSKLNGEYDYKELLRLIKLGISCICSDPEQRPSMRQIASILDGNDKCFMEGGRKREKSKEWKRRNAASLSLIKRIQALGIQ